MKGDNKHRMSVNNTLDVSAFQFPLSMQGLEQPSRIIHRADKGLMMGFFSKCVIKDYRSEPAHLLIPREEQTRRFMAEIQAYQKFNELSCPFVSKLIDFSIEERWFCIERIHGSNILELSQSPTNEFPIRLILDQIKAMAHWLELHSFPSMESNIKDLIFSESKKLYLMDFEPYSPQAEGSKAIDFYNIIIRNFLERIIIRRGKKARLTRRFVSFSLSIMRQSIFMSIRLIICFSWEKLLLLIRENLALCRKLLEKVKTFNNGRKKYL